MTDDVTGRDVHPDLDRLADLDAGVDVDADVHAHTSGCVECQQALAALRATRADLAALPTTSMPADVAARIDAALTDEKTQATQRESAANADTTVVAMPGRRARKRRSSFIASGIAASVVALLIAAVVFNAFSSGGKSNGGGTAASNAATLGSQATSVVTASGRNYTQKNLDNNITALLRTPTVAAFGESQQAGTTSGTGATAGGPAAAPAAPQPSAPLERHATTNGSQQHVIPPQLRSLQTDPNAMTQCINSLLGSPPYVAPLAVDLATYDGKPAAVFVFPKANDPSHVRVYVVPPGGCANGFFEFFKNSVPR
jgi:hypothetical protein